MLSEPRTLFSGTTTVTIFIAFVAAFLVGEGVYDLASLVVQAIVALCSAHNQFLGVSAALSFSVNGFNIDIAPVVCNFAGAAVVIGTAMFLARRADNRLSIETEASRECPRCYSNILAMATRCPYCTSEIDSPVTPSLGG